MFFLNIWLNCFSKICTNLLLVCYLLNSKIKVLPIPRKRRKLVPKIMMNPQKVRKISNMDCRLFHVVIVIVVLATWWQDCRLFHVFIVIVVLATWWQDCRLFHVFIVIVVLATWWHFTPKVDWEVSVVVRSEVV